MLNCGQGTILFTSGPVALRGDAKMALMACPKAALRVLSQCIAREFQPQVGISFQSRRCPQASPSAACLVVNCLCKCFDTIFATLAVEACSWGDHQAPYFKALLMMQGIHVAHIMIQGRIDAPRVRAMVPDTSTLLSPEAIAETYWQLHKQDKSAWTQELDLRPSVQEF